MGPSPCLLAHSPVSGFITSRSAFLPSLSLLGKVGAPRAAREEETGLHLSRLDILWA